MLTWVNEGAFMQVTNRFEHQNRRACGCTCIRNNTVSGPQASDGTSLHTITMSVHVAASAIAATVAR